MIFLLEQAPLSTKVDCDKCTVWPPLAKLNSNTVKMFLGHCHRHKLHKDIKAFATGCMHSDKSGIGTFFFFFTPLIMERECFQLHWETFKIPPQHPSSSYWIRQERWREDVETRTRHLSGAFDIGRVDGFEWIFIYFLNYLDIHKQKGSHSHMRVMV